MYLSTNRPTVITMMMTFVIDHRPIITLEYSVTRMVDDNANTDKTNSASSAADVTDDKQAQDDDGESKHENESTRTKSVQLFTETRPNGRTYMTKK